MFIYPVPTFPVVTVMHCTILRSSLLHAAVTAASIARKRFVTRCVTDYHHRVTSRVQFRANRLLIDTRCPR